MFFVGVGTRRGQSGGIRPDSGLAQEAIFFQNYSCIHLSIPSLCAAAASPMLPAAVAGAAFFTCVAGLKAVRWLNRDEQLVLDNWGNKSMVLGKGFAFVPFSATATKRKAHTLEAGQFAHVQNDGPPEQRDSVAVHMVPRGVHWVLVFSGVVLIIILFRPNIKE